MKIKLISDMHFEFLTENAIDIIRKQLNKHSENVTLVVAGDLHLGTNGIDFLKTLNYKKIIYVVGNHEYYKNDFNTLIDDIRNKTNDTNIQLLENQSLIVDDYIFIGTTMWSMGLNDYNCFMQMNDYNCIINDNVKLMPCDTRNAYYKATGFIYNKLMQIQSKPHLKPIIVTHHLPISTCVQNEFKLHVLNSFFVAQMEKINSMFDIKYWFYGHTHKSNDFVENNTRFICNPYDYRGGNTMFNFDLIIDTEEK